MGSVLLRYRSPLVAQSGRPKTSTRLSLSGKSGQTCSRGFDRIGRE